MERGSSRQRVIVIILNFGKCKCIHIGHGNMNEEYKMGMLF